VDKEQSSESGTNSDTKSIENNHLSSSPAPPSKECKILIWEETDICFIGSKAESRYGTITEDNKIERNRKSTFIWLWEMLVKISFESMCYLIKYMFQKKENIQKELFTYWKLKKLWKKNLGKRSTLRERKTSNT